MILPLVMTVLLAVVLTGLQIRISRTFRISSAPRLDRWHRSPTPSSGGIAIYCAAAFVYLIWFRGEHRSVALAATALWALGLLDDLVRLPPIAKFAGQALAAACLVASGVVFHATSSAPFNAFFSFFWLVGITNAFNLIDNMDGLCSGVIVIISAFRCALLAANGIVADASLCAIVAAAFAGFLFWNYRPARIFMGDCGSMFAGFSLAALTIASPLPHTKAFLAGISYPLLTFTYPIFDTTLVSILRRLAGRPISIGGRDHSSHRLVAAGVSESRAVWILWMLTALGSSIGLLVNLMPFAVMISGALLWISLAFFGRFLASYLGGERRPITTPNCMTVPYGSPSPSENFIAVIPLRNDTAN